MTIDFSDSNGRKSVRRAAAGALGLSLACALPAMAGSYSAGSGKNPVMAEPPVVSESSSGSESFFDTLWALPTLYKNKENPYIQKVAIIGRYHGQWHYTDANTGDDSGWENRRWRLGTKIEFLKDFTFETNLNLDTSNDLSGDRFFKDIQDMFIEWEPNDTFGMVIGKQKPKITQEDITSSKRILTFERSLLVNQIVPDRVWGAVAYGDYGFFDWHLGLFSGDLDGDWDFTEFDGGIGYNASFGFDLTEDTNMRLDYFYNDGDDGNTNFEEYGHLFSLNTTSKFDRWGLNTDILFGTGIEGTSDVFGLMLMPHFDISEKLKLVGRYHFATSDDSDGIRLQSRYERPAVEDGSGDRGDNYHSFYAGLNYYLYGDKLKLMNGVEYSTLGGDADYDGWTFFTGVRMYF